MEEGEVSDSSVSKARKERHSPSKAQTDTSDEELGETEEERLTIVPQPTLAVKKVRVESPPLVKRSPIHFEGIEPTKKDDTGTQHFTFHQKRDLKIILTDKHDADQFKALLLKTQSNTDGLGFLTAAETQACISEGCQLSLLKDVQLLLTVDKPAPSGALQGIEEGLDLWKAASGRELMDRLRQLLGRDRLGESQTTDMAKNL